MAPRIGRLLRSILEPARKPTTLERIAGWAFLAFTVLQVPCFLVNTPDLERHVALSPLQVCAASLVQAVPQAQPAVEVVMLPGSWFRNALAPWLRCLAKTQLKGPCGKERTDLSDLRRAADLARSELRTQGKLIGKDMRGHDTPIIYGSAIIVVSALFSLVHTVKLSLAGFFLLFSGIYQAGHNVLPPFILLFFLCGFAALRLDSPPAQPLAARAPAATLARPPSTAGAASKAPAKAKGK